MAELPSYEEEVNTTPLCPFHGCPLEYLTSKNDWPYVRCSRVKILPYGGALPDCVIFTSQEEAPMYLQSIRQQRHPDLHFGDGKTLPNQHCWCNQRLRLTTSHS